jgi:hypothetical protein
MDNLNMYEPEQVAPQQQPIVSMDALGNTNQVRGIYGFLGMKRIKNLHRVRNFFLNNF